MRFNLSYAVKRLPSKCLGQPAGHATRPHAAPDPGISCRNLADLFNRRHVDDGMTVGRDLTAKLLKHHRADILLRRHELKRRIYKPGQPNRVWGMDGTGKTDSDGTLHFLLGIVDHCSRHCVTLEALADKRSVTVVRALCDAIEQHGKPKAIRTDNEAIFQSRLFKTALGLLGIRHQTTELHCPWQNGRIERFFGTLKNKLDRWAVADGIALNTSLVVFRCW
ncbi:MAG: transposase family protein, partial [Pseudomonadota bacterium]|nr:transposase family protein [Pseudomonadota bacterium]